MNMDERLIELETRLAYQERAIEELNQALTGQQRQLDQLLLRLKRIETHLQQGGEPIARPNEEPPPPHY